MESDKKMWTERWTVINFRFHESRITKKTKRLQKFLTPFSEKCSKKVLRHVHTTCQQPNGEKCQKLRLRKIFSLKYFVMLRFKKFLQNFCHVEGRWWSKDGHYAQGLPDVRHHQVWVHRNHQNLNHSQHNGSAIWWGGTTGADYRRGSGKQQQSQLRWILQHRLALPRGRRWWSHATVSINHVSIGKRRELTQTIPF